MDGWALTLLPPAHVGWAATCQTIGTSTGFFTSFTVFLALQVRDLFKGRGKRLPPARVRARARVVDTAPRRAFSRRASPLAAAATPAQTAANATPRILPNAACVGVGVACGRRTSSSATRTCAPGAWRSAGWGWRRRPTCRSSPCPATSGDAREPGATAHGWLGHAPPCTPVHVIGSPACVLLGLGQRDSNALRAQVPARPQRGALLTPLLPPVAHAGSGASCLRW